MLLQDSEDAADDDFHRAMAFGIIGMSPVVAAILLVVQPSTYGKLHGSRRKSWFGPLLPAKWCWMIFESPNWIWVLYAVWQRGTLPPPPNTLLLLWFLLHYVHRSILYPLQMSPNSKFPVGIMMFLALPYCMINGYLQTQALYRQRLSGNWQFYGGFVLILAGFTLAFGSDQTLLKLRRQSPQRYQIPYGPGFTYVSCPHFLGELLEWTGFCLASNGSWASTSFVIWTACNLIPRALLQHEWYRETFKDYPMERKAILPFVL